MILNKYKNLHFTKHKDKYLNVNEKKCVNSDVIELEIIILQCVYTSFENMF